MRILEKTFQDVRVDLREGLEAIYANYVVARYSKDRFALDFVQIMPRARIHRVKARISMTPQDARRLVGTLCAGHVGVDVGLSREQSSRAVGRDADLGQDGPGALGTNSVLPQSPEAGAGGQKAAWWALKPMVSLSGNLAATPSNVVILSSSPTETVLEFAVATPGYYRVTVSARIVLASPGVRILLDALEGGLSAHACQHGASDAMCGAELVPSLRTPATWGGWLPFALN